MLGQDRNTPQDIKPQKPGTRLFFKGYTLMITRVFLSECNIIGSMICVSWAEIACYRSGRVRFCWSEWWGMIVFCAINKIYQFQT